MKAFLKFAALAACASAIAAQELANKGCPCYTATTHITNNGCPAFLPTKPCIVPMCVMLSTLTIPGLNTHCPTTPTVTSFLPCQTACPSGCATFTSTSAVDGPCLPTGSPTKPTITPPPYTSHTSCYTKTVSESKKCPEDDLTCAAPDCIFLSRTTVPGGPVKECPTTATVTKTRECKGRCDQGCATQWVTETAVPWKG